MVCPNEPLIDLSIFVMSLQPHYARTTVPGNVHTRLPTQNLQYEYGKGAKK